MTTILAIVAGCLVWFLVGLGVGLAIGKIADQDPPRRAPDAARWELDRILGDLEYLNPPRGGWEFKETGRGTSGESKERTTE